MYRVRQPILSRKREGRTALFAGHALAQRRGAAELVLVLEAVTRALMAEMASAMERAAVAIGPFATGDERCCLWRSSGACTPSSRVRICSLGAASECFTRFDLRVDEIQSFHIFGSRIMLTLLCLCLCLRLCLCSVMLCFEDVKGYCCFCFPTKT